MNTVTSTLTKTTTNTKLAVATAFLVVATAFAVIPAITTKTLTLYPTGFSDNGGGGGRGVTITSNVDWTATSNQPWLTVSPASGSKSGSVTIYATENTSASSRVGTVTFTGGGLTRTYTANQAGAALSVGSSDIILTSAAGQKTSTVTSNVNWSATSNKSWLSVSPSTGSHNRTITVAYTSNTSVSSRVGTITITGRGQTRTITVTQAGVISTAPTISVPMLNSIPTPTP